MVSYNSGHGITKTKTKTNTATCRRNNIDCYIDVTIVQAIFKIVLSNTKIFHIIPGYNSDIKEVFIQLT